MFERFTERARQVVVFAQEEARILKHNYIGTEHYLLGLLREEEGLAARVLESLGMTVERVRAEVIRIVGSGEDVTFGQIPFTPRAKKVLDLALQEALWLSHNDIATHHILLGLLREGEGVAVRVLGDFDADVGEVRSAVLAGLEDTQDGEPSYRHGEQTASRRDANAPDAERPGGFRAGTDPGGEDPQVGLFARHTDRAWQVIVLAQDEARILKHNDIATEHILLGLLREEEGLAARVLELLDITVERVRAQVVRIVSSREEVTSGQIPFTPLAKKTLELAWREALSLGHNYIGTEHILLALVRENECVAARILLDFDAGPEKIRNEVIRMLSGPGRRQRGSGGTGDVQFGTRGSALERIGLSDTLLDGAGTGLRTIVSEVERRLGRPADAGDLLVLLASVPDGLAARVLAGLGVDVDALAPASEEARREGTRSALLPPAALLAECDNVRLQKEDAIEAQEFARAAELRDRERKLLTQALTAAEGRRDQMLSELRARLGLGEE